MKQWLPFFFILNFIKRLMPVANVMTTRWIRSGGMSSGWDIRLIVVTLHAVCFENAHLLARPLMLMVGELDDNVDPASTMQVASALIKAKKEFELVVVPGINPTLGGEFGDRKRFDFFVKHLLGVMPPDWNNESVKLKVER